MHGRNESGVILIKAFDKWIPDEEKLDSGKGKKIWLVNPNNSKSCGWFKYLKKTYSKSDKQNEIDTFENVSEKIAELIAKELNLSNAKIDIGTYYGEYGCLSYNILRDKQTMSEGISYISRKYPQYDVTSEKDLETGKYYCLEIILNSLTSKELKNSFLKIVIFDFIIGNSDRHSNNWAIIKTKKGKEIFAPLYDNGSSLCALISEDEIDNYLGNDKMKFNSLIDSKSKTLIRIDGKLKKIPTHKEVIKYLHDNYYEETKDFVNVILKQLNNKKICDILRCVRKYISLKRFELLKRYLLGKVNILEEIYRRGD